MERQDFVEHNMMKAAVVRGNEVIGEAASRITQLLKDAHQEVPRKELAQLRNFYIHVYDRVKYERVWTTANNQIPRIAAAVAALLTPEPPVSHEENPT